MQSNAQKKHRSRSRPTPSGKHTTITEHDIFGIFEPLSRHAQLTTKQLVAFDCRCASKTRNRLTDLYHEQGAWLERLSEDITFANSLFVDEMYRLGDDARALLEAREIIPTHPWVLTSRIGGNSSTPSKIIRLAHDHMASEIALDIEIGVRSTPSVRFRNHIEIIGAAPKRTRSLPHPLRVTVPQIPSAPKWIEPDALFAIGERYYAIEADRGTESIETIIKSKIIAYREIVAACVIDEHFGIDNLRVLFVTTNETRMRNMMQAVADIATAGRSRMFGFACRPDLADFTRAPAPTGHMFARAWERAGYDPLELGKE